MKLYVGNLAYTTGEQDIERLFATHGDIASVKIIRDRDTGRSRGFAFVEMADGTQGQAAMRTLDQHEFEGRRLTVNEAKPMEPGFGGGARQRREPRW